MRLLQPAQDVVHGRSTDSGFDAVRWLDACGSQPTMVPFALCSNLTCRVYR